jgi:hypothetical protein
MHETKGHFCQKVVEDLLEVVRHTVLAGIFMLDGWDIYSCIFFTLPRNRLLIGYRLQKPFFSPRFSSLTGQYSSVLPLISCLETMEKNLLELAVFIGGFYNILGHRRLSVSVDYTCIFKFTSRRALTKGYG